MKKLSYLAAICSSATLFAQGNLNASFNGRYPLDGSNPSSIRLLKAANFIEDRHDKPDAALYVSIASQGLALPNLQLKPATRFSISLWVYASKAQTVENFFTETNLCIHELGCVFPAFDFDGKSLPVREWFMLTMTYKDGVSSIFVNDEPTPRLEHEFSFFSDLNQSVPMGIGYAIGEAGSAKTCFTGAIDDVVISNKAISKQDRVTLFAQSTHQPNHDKVSPPTPDTERTESPKIADQTPPYIKFASTQRGNAPKEKNGHTMHLVEFVAGDAHSAIAAVYCDGQRLTIPEPGRQEYTFSFEVPMKSVAQSLEIVAEDAHGNRSSKTIEIPKKPEVQQSTAAINAQSIAQIEQSNYHALLIAVEEYDEESLSLQNTLRDAQRLQDILARRYSFPASNITLLEDPDKEELVAALDELKANLTPNDNLLIFYAGHGFWDKELKKSFWLPADAERDNRTNWYSANELQDALAAMKAQHVLLVSDACYSGGILKDRDIDQRLAYEKMFSKPSRRAITSGDLESVPDESVFLKYFIKSLETNTEKYLFSQDLFVDFRKAVIHNSPNQQTPTTGTIPHSNDEGGDFIFRLSN